MGNNNVHADSISSPLSPTLDSVPEISSGVNEKSHKLGNPGTIEDLHKKCKDIFPNNFEGAKIILNKGLSSRFQVSHTINMSSPNLSGYRFGATYVGTKRISSTEIFPILLGEIDPNGNLNANIIHQLTSRVKGKFAAQIQRSKFTGLQMTSDYSGDSYSCSVTLGNPDIINNSGVLVVHYLQSITPSIALGGEFTYQKAPAISGGSVAVMSAVGRYTNGESTVSANFSFGGGHLCFHHKASDQVQIAIDLEVNSKLQESTTTFGYQVDLPKAALVFKGNIDTNWSIGGVLEKKLQPLPLLFVLSGLMNHKQKTIRLGCGLVIG